MNDLEDAMIDWIDWRTSGRAFWEWQRSTVYQLEVREQNLRAERKRFEATKEQLATELGALVHHLETVWSSSERVMPKRLGELRQLVLQFIAILARYEDGNEERTAL